MNVNYQLEKEQKLTQDHVCVLASLFLYVCGLSLFPSPSRWWSCGLAFPCSLHGQSFISSWCLNTTMCCFVFVAIMVVLSVFPDCCCLEAFHEYFLFSLFLEPSSWSLVNAFIHWLGWVVPPNLLFEMPTCTVSGLIANTTKSNSPWAFLTSLWSCSDSENCFLCHVSVCWFIPFLQ